MPARGVAVLTAAAALDLVSGGLDPDAVGPLAGRPALVVALDGGGDARRLAAVARAGAGLPCVVVGVGEPGVPDEVVEACDVVVTGVVTPPAPWVGPVPAAADPLAAVLDGVAAGPSAAATLAQVLRTGVSLGVGAALAVESLAYGLLQAGPEHRAWLAAQPPRSAPPGGPAVRVERHGDDLHVTLARPERRNAYGAAMRDELIDALRLAAAADTGIAAVHLRGDGPSFSSGGDLGEFGSVPDPVTAHAVRTARSAASWLATVGERIPVHAHVHGAVVGAGIELAAHCGRVEAAPGTTFRLPEVAMGLVPGAGGTAGLPRRIGRHRTAWLAISGVALDVDTALAWGLVDAVVDEAVDTAPPA